MSKEKKETLDEILKDIENNIDKLDGSYHTGDGMVLIERIKKATELKGENIDDSRELVTELWRDGNNVGARFTFKKKDIMWQDMTIEQRQECVQNMIQMSRFFYQFLTQTERKV